MKKILIIIVINMVYFSHLVAARPSPQPEKVYRFIYVQKSMDWYVEQAQLWKKEIEKRPNDPEVWYNYFMATKYTYWRGDLPTYKHKMDSLLSEMSRKIPNSYEYNYLRFYNGDRDITLLKKAYELDPHRVDAIYELVSYYEIQGDMEKLPSFCLDLYKSRDISPGLLNYNYNVLVSTAKSGILFTNGDNDTYPVWVLQHALDIRKDITLLNLSLIFGNRNYLKRKLEERNIVIDSESLSQDKMNVFVTKLVDKITQKYPEIPIYLAATVNTSVINEMEENLYLVGLAFKYSAKRFDNLALLKDNLSNNLRLDYLDYDWYSEQYLVTPWLQHLNLNYVVIYLKLAEFLHDSGKSAEAEEWKNKALLLAQKAGNKEFINHIHELNW